MRITKRVARKEAYEHGYRSKFEFTFSERLKELKLKAKYESSKLKYIVPQTTRTYTPDWEIGKDIFIETKGRFTASDRKKILLVKAANPKVKVYMLFQNAQVKLSKVSNTTYAEWCNKNEIIWADIRDEDTWKGWFKK